jgi:hypothetical protein
MDFDSHLQLTLKRFGEEVAKALQGRDQTDADLRRQITEIEHGIANLVCGLSDRYSPAITAEIARGENVCQQPQPTRSMLCR